VSNDSTWELRVNVNKDREYVTKWNAKGGKGGKMGFTLEGGVEYEWDKVNKTGLSVVFPGDTKCFHVTGNPDVFLTILAIMPNGKLKVLDNARPIQSDRSVVVTRNGGVPYAKYGTLWQREF